MRTISLRFEPPKIEINGIVYDVRRSDAQVVQDMLDIDAKYANEDQTDSAVVLRKNGDMLSYLDKLLSCKDGAVKSIIGSVPGLKDYGLGLSGLDGILGHIVQAAGKAYSDALTVKYDD